MSTTSTLINVIRDMTILRGFQISTTKSKVQCAIITLYIQEIWIRFLFDMLTIWRSSSKLDSIIEAVNKGRYDNNGIKDDFSTYSGTIGIIILVLLFRENSTKFRGL